MEEKQTIKKCPRCGFSPSGKDRSQNQNRYYWGCVVQILSEELGYERDEVHEMLKYKFLTSKLPVETSKTRINLGFVKSTTELDTKEFEEFLSSVRVWASRELGIYIQEPNEETNKNWFDK